MFTLRTYQDDALDLTYKRIAEGHRPIVCAPTGSGKTVIAAEMARRGVSESLRVMFVSFRREILRQTVECFSDHCGASHVGLLMSGEPFRFYPPITVASADTLKARWDRASTWRVPADLILVDEAHLSLSAKMSETVMPYYRDKTVIGFTATPARATGKGLGSFYTRIIQVRTVQQLIDEGFLAPCEYWAGTHIDTSKLRTRMGDYEQKSLSAAAGDKVLIGDIVDNWLRLASDRHTIVFAVDIAHAMALEERFKAAGVRAECVHSKMDVHTRSMLTDQFKRRSFDVLVNVGIATYGYDVPSVNCVVLARPTKSIVFHLQAIGRGMRPKPDGDHCMVLDHADNVRRLGCAEDLIRWRLDEGKEAAHNQSKAEREQRGETQTTCDNCQYVFSQSRTCPKCGWEKPMPAKDIEVVEADLVQIRKAKKQLELEQIDRRQWYQMAKGWCRNYGKKPGMAYYAHKDKFGLFPASAWSHDPPMEPDIRVSAYMKGKLIRYAKRRRA